MSLFTWVQRVGHQPISRISIREFSGEEDVAQLRLTISFAVLTVRGETMPIRAEKYAANKRHSQGIIVLIAAELVKGDAFAVGVPMSTAGHGQHSCPGMGWCPREQREQPLDEKEVA